MEFLAAVARGTWFVLYEGALYIMLGFAVAGILREFLPTHLIARHLGAERPRSVVLAALFGAPIPLCSCGVLPAATALRRKGASRSSLTSFLISTPETGVDSIALTYGLMGPVMAVVRPVVAVTTAILAGCLSILVRDEPDAAEPQADEHGAGCDALHAGHEHAAAATLDDVAAPPAPPAERGRRALHYGFVTLLDDLAFWLTAGILFTGILTALLPDDFFGVLGWDRGLAPMLVMLVVGVPLYLCASASTPVAAALVAKGLSPGAALVFLLAGPATSLAAIAISSKLLGLRRLRIYLGSIAVVSVTAGLFVDAFLADAIRATTLGAGRGPESGLLVLLKLAAALAFTGLLAVSFQRTRFREGRADVREQGARLRQALQRFDPRMLLRLPVLAAAGLLALVLFGPPSVLVVGPGERGIAMRFGRVVAPDLGPGLHLHLPPPLGRGLVVDTELVRQVAVGFRLDPEGARAGLSAQSYYLTADENIVDLRSVVHYRVDDAVRFALGLDDADDLVRSLARSELLRIVSGTPIDTLYATARRQTEQALRRALRERAAGLALGLEIVDARLLDVHAPPAVHDAFRDVASALEDRQREVHEASGYRAERRAEAEGEAAALVEAARAAAARAAAMAASESAAFAAVASVHAEDPGTMETRLHLETLERALAKPRLFVLALGDRASDVDLWLGGAPLAPAPLPIPIEGSGPGSGAQRGGRR
jgi:HflK protein